MTPQATLQPIAASISPRSWPPASEAPSVKVSTMISPKRISPRLSDRLQVAMERQG